MDELSRAQRKLLRDLAAEVYEVEARVVLEELAVEFDRWRQAETSSSDLFDAIHAFHQGRSRELWSMYQHLKAEDIVSRGVVLGFLAEGRIPEPILRQLKPRIDSDARRSA